MHPVPKRAQLKRGVRKDSFLAQRRLGRVAMQRIANPWTSVRLREAPPLFLLRINATLAQLVERNLAKVEVTSSNLVCRSKIKAQHLYAGLFSFLIIRNSILLQLLSNLSAFKRFPCATAVYTNLHKYLIFLAG